MRYNNLPIAFLAFAGLGLHDGLLGVAWPSMRRTFDVPLDAAGVILFVMIVGYFVSTTASGPLADRMGAGRLAMAGSALRAAGLAGMALTPVWWGVIVSAALSGIGGGAIDAGLNAYVAVHHTPGQMNWLHASYGVGVTVSPLALTALLVAGRSWRLGYAGVGVLQVALVLIFALTLTRWQVEPTPDTATGPPAPTRPRGLSALAMPVVWASIVALALMSALEVVTGQWAFTLFTEGRGVPVGVAGTWVSLYWGSFTLGRIVLGFGASRVAPDRVLRVGLLGTIAGAGLLWWNPTNAIGFGGLALFGLAMSPLYPYMLSSTPRRVGVGLAASAIGFQMGGGGLGAATLPGLAGVLADSLGLEVVGLFILILSVLAFLSHEAVMATARPHTLPDARSA